MRGGGGGIEETLLEDEELDGEAAKTFPIFDRNTMWNSLTQDLIGSIGGHIGTREEIGSNLIPRFFNLLAPLQDSPQKHLIYFEMIIACY